MSNTPFNPFAALTCHEAATEILDVMGIEAYGPHVGDMVRSLRSCNNAECPGHSRIEIITSVMSKTRQDVVLALLN